MTLFSYEIFDAVARQGSFNKAAQQLHLTPSAISHAVSTMEAECGFPLFTRTKSGVTMTAAAENFTNCSNVYIFAAHGNLMQ